MAEYLTFKKVHNTGKTAVYSVTNLSGFELGFVRFYPQWRKYVFQMSGELIFDSGCLSEIKNFIDNLMNKRKIKKAANGSTGG